SVECTCSGLIARVAVDVSTVSCGAAVLPNVASDLLVLLSAYYWYGKSTTVRPSADGRGAPGPGGRPALARRLCPPAGANSPGQRPGRAGRRDRAPRRLQRASRPRCHPGL